MSFILIATGVYLAISITSFNYHDLFVSVVFLGLMFFILIRSFFIINKKKDFLKPKNIILFIALILILVATLYQCNHNITHYGKPTMMSCSIDETCEVCNRCLYIFGSAALVGILAIFGISKIKVKKRIR